MKNAIFIALLSLSFSPMSLAQQTVDCSNGQCNPSFTPQLLLEKPFYTAIDVGNNNQDIEVSVPVGQTPRSLRIHLNNGENLNDLTIDLSSKKEGANSADLYVIGDLFRNLTVKLNGFNGTKGKDASEICAANILAGEYGSDIKNFFEQRRASDPGVPATNCDRVDLNYMQTFGFTCDDPSYQFTPGTNPVIDVDRLRTKARCNGTLVRDICLRRKRTITCLWRAQYTDCSKKGGCRNHWLPTSTRRYLYRYNYIDTLFSHYLNAWGASEACRRAYTGKPGNIAYGGVTGFYVLEGFNHSLSSPGTDAAFVPLAGSNWQMYKTTAYGSCASWWTSERTEVTSVVTYDENNTACDDVSHASDPLRLIDWTYSGPAQEPSFGIETVQCAVGACPVNNTVSEFNRELDRINPESGSDGSQQGSGLVFIYDTENLTSESTIGQAGAAGKSDLAGNESIKYCYKKTDASTNGNESDFARNPSVSFRKYRWQALRVEGIGDTGNPPPSSSKQVEIYKKVDSSVRHLLKEELF